MRHNNVGGVTAGQAPHNSSNVGIVTAGQMGHNASYRKAINSHLALPIGPIELVLRYNRHLNSKTVITMYTSKDGYKYPLFSRPIAYWNSLPDKIFTIKNP